MVQKLEMIYEGKAKKVYKTDNPDLAWVEYKDDATAFNGLKKGTIMGKGELNNKISAHFFELLAQKGVPNHFVELKSDTEQVVKILQIIMVEVIVRNIAAGSLAKRLGLEEGTPLKHTVLEYCYKNDELGDPMINDYHIAALGLATKEQMAQIAEMALKVNEVMREYLKDKNIDLIDFKLEFGLHRGKVLLGDEISPDTCRFWDTETKKKLDKDRFRRDLGDVEDAYREILKRLQGGE
ncbi:phosphoribosylaminoimidazolesuccinocarboxamide synthase [Candidatus Formimonas warabiya]|uniref:Phosphoribosylaminoimidazole-succinocarboxamide synthase n=1 Tax=Formimonas warabiya TaxID=1761012 RepID=A0A3G1KLU7_FORW1|nr:phosphoribosylaminoimidazolesuccinocarboxamide synthase [Candidatus Formimonas warabiya]